MVPVYNNKIYVKMVYLSILIFILVGFFYNYKNNWGRISESSGGVKENIIENFDSTPLVRPKSSGETSLETTKIENSQGEELIHINAKEFGAKGDGKTNDRVVLQKAIDSIANSESGGTLFLPEGVYAIYDQSLALWGNNISLIGENRERTVILKRGNAGQYGDCVDIIGKVKGLKYFGDFGKGAYNKRTTYLGKTIPARDIKIANITLDTKLTKANPLANNLGIINCERALIENCNIKNALQSNVAIVNVTNQHKNGKVKFRNCTFSNSGTHNVRVISYNQGNLLGNDITFEKCRFLEVSGADVHVKELKKILNGEKKVHLWYRGAKASGATKVLVKDSYFDSSGIIFANGNVNGLILTGNKIESTVYILHSYRDDLSPAIRINNNRFSKRVDLVRKTLKRSEKDIFSKKNNVYIYPGMLLKKTSVDIDNNPID
ncbi:hypothetical protein ED312_18625 [Sinomicrobium pectinilyticum]|uniref:Rhamnogalacturonase A/B/Epimerase-like pectate lyase domain-containing protein n=1 Tax=Sinomicrobium pectinilyticum TaxID=1084421 RepID=A0A3N0E1B0_SINP1|nr:glycosyl hydrolase family 28-related protein [Sinomicrobium pectinilyticum]RNL81625.1 hypothetical protein ED312_18625 [Sinomicrobium pectinilyticum]